MIGNSPYKEDIARLFREGLELERLHGKTILVAGATGLVGGCVVDVLMQNPARCYKVIAAGRNKERARQKFAAYWEDESFFFAEIDVTQPVIKSMNRMIGNQSIMSWLRVLITSSMQPAMRVLTSLSRTL